MKLTPAMILLIMPLVAAANTISVGGQSVKVPTPSGYAPVTSEMSELYELQKMFVAPTNEEFITFIPEELIPAVLQGEIPEINRWFSVQTARTIASRAVTSTDFRGVKDKIRTENDQLIKKVEGQLPGLMGKINEDFSGKYDVNLALSLSQLVPLPVHDESERSLAYSAFIKYNMNDEHGRPATFVSVVTMTLVHVNGRLLFLYSYGDENDLEWTRRASKEWVTRLISDNPGTLETRATESAPSSARGIDWGKVGAKAIVGGFIGLIAVLIGGLFNRRKSS